MPSTGAGNEASNSLPRFSFWLKMILAPIVHYSLLTINFDKSAPVCVHKTTELIVKFVRGGVSN